jgi:hypothetical protein
MIKCVSEDRSITDPVQRHLMLVLAAVYHNPKHGCFPSIKQLMEQTGYSRSTIFVALNQLKKDQRIFQNSGGGRGKRNAYTVCYERQAENDKIIKAFSENLSSSSNNNSQNALPTSKRTKQPFKAPTIEEFTAYALSNGISQVDAQDQFRIWDANNWHDGHNNPIKNWKGKLVTFQIRGYLPSNKRHKPQSQPQQNQGAPRLI